jgi:hypothetical protein
MIYSSFVLCAGHLLGFIILYGLACLFFALNIYLKDRTSYRFKQGWEEYRQRSYVLFPKLFSSKWANLLLYVGLLSAVGWFVSLEQPPTFADFGFSHMAQ